MLTAYFDTNVFDQIHRSGGRSSPEFAAVSRALQARVLRIAIGLHVLDETVAAYDTRPVATLERLDLIEVLADPHLVVRPVADILHDHVVATLASEPEPAPFTSEPIPFRRLRTTLAEDPARLQALLRSNSVLAERNAATLTECQASLRTELAARRWPKVAFPVLLEGATWMLQSLVDSFFGPGALSDSVLRTLRRSRAIFMYQAASLSLFYAHSAQGNRVRPSDLPDLHHAVAAAGTNALVTADTRLVEVVRRVPLRDFSVYTVPELVSHLQAHT